MLRKLMSMSLVVVLSGAVLVGCSSNEVADINVESTEVVEETNGPVSIPVDTVLVDNDVVKISITEKYDDGPSEYYREIGYKVTVENKTDRNITVSTDYDGSVNGVMNNPNFVQTVTAGNTAMTNMYWWVGENSEEFNPNVKSIEDLKDIKFTLRVYDNDVYEELVETFIEME